VRLLLAYPGLIWRYLRLPAHEAVLVGYLGIFDLLVIKLFARLRGAPVCWDIFISLYDTVVKDRKLAGNKLVKWGLYGLEWLAARTADLLIMDTQAHASYFASLYGLPQGSVHRVFVGAETKFFPRVKHSPREPDKPFTVLFYGQFIPLQGIETIVAAAKITEDGGRRVRWIIIGSGQEQPRIDALIARLGVKSIERIAWVPYEALAGYIHEADVCLGIFDAGGKATRVIPNKIFQTLAVGAPVITADTPAIRELLAEGPAVRLVEPGNPAALAAAVWNFQETGAASAAQALQDTPLPVIGPREVADQLADVLRTETV
jgi:glycosyltransferase involved in cell wall biosynthesis